MTDKNDAKDVVFSRSHIHGQNAWPWRRDAVCILVTLVPIWWFCLLCCAVAAMYKLKRMRVLS